MSILKKLAGQTAIYGISSIIGRTINYFLTPVYIIAFTTKEFGEYTELYSYVAFLIVVLTYGMETAFFKFSSQNKDSKYYNTALSSLFYSSTLFLLFSFLMAGSLASFIGYENHPEYIRWFAIILAVDAFSSIPMARLRQENKPKKFATVNLISIGVNILLNLFFIGYCKIKFDNGNTNALIDTVYNPELGISYIFIANIASSLIKPILLYKQISQLKFTIDAQVLKQMLLYSSPLIIAGLAGIVNETIDRIMLRNILESIEGEQYAKEQVGIYGGLYKLSIIISLFIQAFRYAAEPFFFQQAQKLNGKKAYGIVMNYFVIFLCIIFLAITLYIDIVKHFTPSQDFWNHLGLVPILLLANIFLGISYNLSIWYKLSNNTQYGAIIATIGAVITLVLNALFIPIYGIYASAIITLLVYFYMCIAHYRMGQRFYPIHYNVKKIIFYLSLALVCFFVGWLMRSFTSNFITLFIIGTLILAFYVWVCYRIEKFNFDKIRKLS